MKLIKYYFNFFIAFIKKYFFLMIFGIIVGILTIIFIGLISNNSHKIKSTVIGVWGSYHPDNLPDLIQQKVSYGLTTITDNGNVVEGIAKSWSTEDSGKVWNFTLNDNIYWQDGTKLKLSDLNYNYSDITIEYSNPDKLIFKLKNPFSPLPTVLSKPVFKKGLVGLSKYKIEDIKLAGSYIESITLKSNEERIIYKYYPTLEKLKTAFKLGKIDIIQNISEFAPFENWNNVSIEPIVDQEQIVTLFFNTKSEYFSDKDFRQAAFYAIDKSKMENRAYSPINRNSWAYNPQVKTYEYNIDKSKDLLKNIKLPENREYIDITTIPSLLKIAEQVSDSWKSIGLKSNVRVVSLTPQEYDVYLTIYNLPKDPDQYSLWHSTQSSTNLSKYSNPRIDKLLEDGRSTLDKEERKKIYFDFQRFLLEDLPAGFLYNPVYYNISRK